MSAPRVSVIIPVFNDAPGLRACLDALSRQTVPNGTFEAIVVDNGSREPAARIAAAFSFAQSLLETKPGSYSARNAGIRAARGNLLAFTDADCVPDPGWLESALGYLEQHPEAGVLGGAVTLTTRDPPSAAELYEKLFGFPQSDFVERLGFSVTANMVVRREIMERVRPFNDSLLSGGDMEWGQRASRHGYRPVYVPGMVVRHRARTTFGALARKHRRMAGGHIRVEWQQRGWLRAAWLALKPAFPMRRAIKLFPRRRQEGVSVGQAVMVACILIALAAVSQAERVRVLWGGKPRRE